MSNKKYTYLKKSIFFVNKYPQSNLIFNLLKQVYLQEQVYKKEHIQSLIDIFENSQTNVLPLILSILDMIKKNKMENCLYFLKQISNDKDKLSDSDKIWILCFMKKNKLKLQLNIWDKCFKDLWDKLCKYFTNNNQKNNLFHDADKWSYGEI